MRAPVSDPFLNHFFQRIPAEVAETFTDAQLDAIKRAFGARTPGSHTIDLRFSIPLPRRCYYLVLLAGKERRSPERIDLERMMRPLWSLANGLSIVTFTFLFLFSFAAVLYAGKRALGIDLFPGADMLNDRFVERLLK